MSHIPIRVSTLRGDQKIDFDAFVKINDKFILYLRKGDSFEGNRLVRLKEKKLKKMFILPDDEKLYRNYLQKNIEMAYDSNSGKSLDVRTEIIHGNQQSNVEEVMENADNEAAYSEAKSAAGKFVEFLNKEDTALGHIVKMENLDASVAHHGVTVSTLAIALAKRLGITDAKQTQLLSLGALLHDFDHFHNGLAINRPVSQFNPQEMTIYKNHPTAGATRVQDKRHFDRSVINIIAQHEEYIDGKGFPRGLTESKLDPLAVIVASCNALDRLMSFEGVPKKDAGKQLLLNRVGCYPLNHLQLLVDIMNKVQF